MLWDRIARLFNTPFSTDFKEVRNIFLKYLPKLNKDEKLRSILKQGCKCVAKRGRTLKDMLPPSEFISDSGNKTWPFQPGFHPCGGMTCNVCKFAIKNLLKKSTTLKMLLNCLK